MRSPRSSVVKAAALAAVLLLFVFVAALSHVEAGSSAGVTTETETNYDYCEVTATVTTTTTALTSTEAFTVTATTYTETNGTYTISAYTSTVTATTVSGDVCPGTTETQTAETFTVQGGTYTESATSVTYATVTVSQGTSTYTTTGYSYLPYETTTTTYSEYVSTGVSSTSTTSTQTSSPESHSVSSTSTYSSSTSASEGGASDILIGIVVALALIGGGLGFFLFTRSRSGEAPQTTEAPPPPPPPQNPPQPPPPQAYAPPDTTVSCCGPDITANVLGCMLVMMNDFFSWGPQTQSKELDFLTALTGEPNFNNAWDISELAPSEARGEKLGGGYKQTLKRYESQCMKPDPPCNPSVTFLGQCHHPQVVNYIEWGVLARLNEWKKGGTADGYNDTTFHALHNERSGVGVLVIARNDQLIEAGMTDKLDYSPLDSNFQDQVAMANVGYRLASDYIARRDNGTLPYKLGQVNIAALTALLVALQNPGRPTAKCNPGCEGCGKYQSPGPQNLTFNYTFGEQVGEYVPLSKL